MNDVAWIALTSTLAALFQGTVGFGAALIAVPVFLLLLPASDAVPLASLLGIMSALGALVGIRRFVIGACVRRFTLGAVLGVPVGVVALSLASADVLRIAIAAVICVVVLRRAPGARPESPVSPHLVPSGIAAGALAAALGTPGPPLYWSLVRAGHRKNEIRATLLATLVLVYVVALSAHAVAGAFADLGRVLIAVALVGGLAGGALGNVAAGALDEATYRTLGRVVLGATAIALLVQVLR